MSRSRHAIQVVGQFFGVTEPHPDNPQQWKQRAETKLKDREFGISIKRSTTKRRSGSIKFFLEAGQMLSQIKAVQQLEERQDNEVQEQATCKTSAVEMTEPTAGPSRMADDSETDLDIAEIIQNIEYIDGMNFFKQDSTKRQTDNASEEKKIIEKGKAEKPKLEEEIKIIDKSKAGKPKLEEERKMIEKGKAEKPKLEEEIKIIDKSKAGKPKLEEEIKIIDKSKAGKPKLEEERKMIDKNKAAKPKLAEEKKIIDKNKATKSKLAEEKKMIEKDKAAKPKLAEEKKMIDKNKAAKPKLAEEKKMIEKDKAAKPKLAEEKKMIEKDKAAKPKLAEEKKMIEKDKAAKPKLAEEKKMIEKDEAAKPKLAKVFNEMYSEVDETEDIDNALTFGRHVSNDQNVIIHTNKIEEENHKEQKQSLPLFNVVNRLFMNTGLVGDNKVQEGELDKSKDVNIEEEYNTIDEKKSETKNEVENTDLHVNSTLISKQDTKARNGNHLDNTIEIVQKNENVPDNTEGVKVESDDLLTQIDIVTIKNDLEKSNNRLPESNHEIGNIPDTDSEDNTKLKTEDKENLGPEDFVYGNEAYAQYKFYVQIENKVNKKKLEGELHDKMSEYDWKIQAIDDLIGLAKDYYLNPKSKNAESWKMLKSRVGRSSCHNLGRTEVRRKLATLPHYRPFFTYFIILAQLVSFGVVCGLGGLTYIGLEPRLTLEHDVPTFMGMETVHKWTAPNVWIGPDQRHIVSVGGVFAPCMRDDLHIQLLYSRQNYSTNTPLGCCEVASRNVAGTTTEAECHTLTEGVGYWRAGTTCAERQPTDASVRHTMKPCCIGLKGQCQLLSHKHCVFMDGIYHQFDKQHCSQVNCLSNICTPGSVGVSADQPWLPSDTHQWWRLPLSLLHHHGIIHVVMVTVAQWLLLTQIERTAGWLRMIIIYTLSGIGALVTSSILSPYQSHVGGVGAVFGMVGVIVVELIQFWSLIHKPHLELLKILAAMILFIFCGTLPYLDIFSLISGFILGVLSGIILLPYITFQKWHTRVRIILIAVALPLLLVILFLLFILFVKVQSIQNCHVCQLINCIHYTENMCKTELWM